MTDAARLARMVGQFCELRGQWLDAMTGDHDNAIWRQLAFVIHEEAWFKTILKIRERAGNPAVGAYTWDSFVTGWAIKQSLAIRRLTDTDRKTGSLLRLVKSMKGNQHLMTREIVVSFDGTPWDAAEIADRVVDPATGRVDELAYQALSDFQRANDRFDLLRSEPLDAPRCANDKVAPAVFEKLEVALSSPAILRIRAQCDTSIAHADLSDLANIKGPTFNDIHEAVATLFRVREFLRLDLLNHGSGPIVPINGHRFMDNIDQPLVPSAPKSDYMMVWNEVERELEALVARKEVQKFALWERPG